MGAHESPRSRRLRHDFEAISKLSAESTIFTFDVRSSGNGAPHEYLLRYQGAGLWRPAHSHDVYIRAAHEVAVRLGANYPRSVPELAWRSPVFHPNISTSGVVCLGGYGSFWAPSLQLDELCTMLWDMLRYANYDVDSPYNREAALWARTQQQYRFPLDERPLRDRLAAAHGPGVSPRAGASAAAAPPDIEFLTDVIAADVVDAEVVEEPREILVIE